MSLHTAHIQVPFAVALSALEYLKADGDGKAWMLSMLRFYFIIILVTIEDILQRLIPLTFLQVKHCDLVEAAKEAVTVISQLQESADP